MSDAAPITVDGSEAIAPSVDFEPEVVSCDRYEQIVELVGFENESQYLIIRIFSKLLGTFAAQRNRNQI